MKQVVWKETYIDLGGCSDPECCSQSYWAWRNEEGECETDQEEATRNTAHAFGMENAFQHWYISLQEVEEYLKQQQVELIFVEDI